MHTHREWMDWEMDKEKRRRRECDRKTGDIMSIHITFLNFKIYSRMKIHLHSVLVVSCAHHSNFSLKLCDQKVQRKLVSVLSIWVCTLDVRVRSDSKMCCRLMTSAALVWTPCGGHPGCSLRDPKHWALRKGPFRSSPLARGSGCCLRKTRHKRSYQVPPRSLPSPKRMPQHHPDF